MPLELFLMLRLKRLGLLALASGLLGLPLEAFLGIRINSIVLSILFVTNVLHYGTIRRNW
jgi:hypothetical protein